MFILNSCSKEGCTDALAHNYNPSATKDDGKCYYGLSENAAQFTFEFSELNPNIVNFMAVSNGDYEYSWDLGNGKTSNGDSVTGIYPFSGSKSVTLTVLNSNGHTSSTQQFDIVGDDFSLLTNPMVFYISGGSSAKTWYVDSNSSAHIGVGPISSSSASWYSSQPNEKPGVGLYDDRYIFNLNNFLFDMQTNGSIYIHNSFASNFPGSFLNLYDFTAPFENPSTGNWDISNDSILSFSQGLHMGFYTGVNEYKITKLTEDTLWLEYAQSNNPEAKWFAKFISIDNEITNPPPLIVYKNFGNLP